MSAAPAPDLGAVVAELVRIRELLERGAPAAPPARDPDARLKVRAAALEAGVHVESLRSAIALGRIPAHNAGRRLTTVRRGDVEGWLAGAAKKETRRKR